MKVQRGERKTSKKAHPCIVWHCAEREGGRRRFYGRVATAEIPRQNANCALFPIFFWLGVDGSQSPLSFQREGFILGRPNIIYSTWSPMLLLYAWRHKERDARTSSYNAINGGGGAPILLFSSSI